MNKLFSLLFLLTVIMVPAQARERYWNYCQQGGQSVSTATITSSTTVQKTYPGCVVQVNITGTSNLATVYSNNSGGTQANPFTVDATTGYFDFYADNGTYDVLISSGGVDTPFTWAAISIIEPFSLPPIITDTDPQYNGLTALCAAATSKNAVLYLSKAYTNVSTLDCGAFVWFLQGSSIQPSSANTFTTHGYYALPTQQVWNLASGGLVRVSTNFKGSTLNASNFSTFAGACDTANTGAVALSVTLPITGLPSQTCSVPIMFTTSGSIQPAASQTVTFSMAQASLSKICDISLGGKCIINTPNAEIYPEWWGAVAGQDSTAAFQAALNMISSTTKSMKLIVPNNDVTAYKISTTLTYTGSSDFGSSLVMEGIVSGAGGRGSILLWTGASGGILMHVTDCHKCRINHVSFQGNALALTDFWLDASDTTGATQSADDSFDDVSLSGMAGTGSVGLRISHTGCTNADVAEIVVRNSQIIGNNSGIDTGVSYECGGNSKNITYDNDVVESLGTGLSTFNGSFGWTNVLGTYFANNQIDMQTTLGSLNVIGGGSEGSFKLFDMGAGQNICNLTMIGFYWSGNTISNDNIGTSSGCSMDISNNKFLNGRTSGSIPRIVLSGGFPPIGCTGTLCGMVSLTSHGNFFLNADATHGAYYDAGGSPLGVYYGTYVQPTVNTNQMQVQVWGDYGGTALALTVPLPNYSFAQPRILTPASPTDKCTPPQLTYDTIGNEYRCTAVNTWIAAGGAASYIATESGSNNAIAGAPTFPLALAAGLQIRIKLAHSLQAGANTFAYNGGSAIGIQSSRNPSTNITTAYVSGGFVNLLYTGSIWVDISQ